MIARAVENMDIPQAVIPALAVVVVDRLPGQKVSAQLFLGYKDVLENVAVRCPWMIRRVAVDVTFGVDGPPAPPVGIEGTGPSLRFKRMIFLFRPPAPSTLLAAESTITPLARLYLNLF